MNTHINADNVPLPFTEESITKSGGHETPTPPSLSEVVITAPALLDLEIKPRKKLLGKWAREGDLGYVYAPRGQGKTWMTMLIGNAMAQGGALGQWEGGEEARHVLYFDAEMNLPDVQERARMIGICDHRFGWLQNEHIAEKQKRRLNIAETSDQEEISKLLPDGSVFIIDNLSTAACGMAENDNDAFDIIKEWLLDLRSRGITVIIVHHAGRNGEMRGASRREDMAHWIISLKDDSKDGQDKAWVTQFKKCRNCHAADAPALRWTINTSGGKLTFSSELHSGPEAMLAMIREGIQAASELSEELGVTTGCVSKWAKKLADGNQIEIKGRKYFAVP